MKLIATLEITRSAHYAESYEIVVAEENGAIFKKEVPKSALEHDSFVQRALSFARKSFNAVITEDDYEVVDKHEIVINV